MQRLATNDPETKSPDLTKKNLAALCALFPELVTEGPKGTAINVDVLKQLVGDRMVSDAEEKYGLNWHGKRRARQLALTPSTGTLRPCPEESVDWDTTQNLMIEGDNLEVLKLLQKSYAGKVKLIYIDPPYNTGKDFIYPDNFRDNVKNYLELTGQNGKTGKKLSSNTETSGRFHTNWLNMMYPRLILARNLLQEDGLMIVHMDEHEQANTHALLAEVFGEENILGASVWDKKNPKNDASHLAYQHETLFFVAKNQSEFAAKCGLTRRKKNAETIIAKAKQLFERIGKQELPVKLKACAMEYKLPDQCLRQYYRIVDLENVNEEFSAWIRTQGFSGGEKAYSRIDESGDVFRLVSMAWPNEKPAPDEYFIPLKHPVTGLNCPVPRRGWRNPPQTMKRLLDAGEIVFGSDHTTQPQRKYLLKNNMTENFPSVVVYSRSDNVLLAQLGIPFDNPKPVELAKDLIATVARDEDIVLDFFAGSGTTGHAVMAQNAADGGNRRYILVQLPEPLDAKNKSQKIAAEYCEKLGKPGNIAELTKERLRRAAKKIKTENPHFAGDLGFRVFKLDSTNICEWDPDGEILAASIEPSLKHLKTDRTDKDILFELVLKFGFELCVPIETKKIASQEIHSIGAGSLLVCLSSSITQADIEPLAFGLAAWHKQLKPPGETTVIFRNNAFANDMAKTNLTAILQQHGLETIRSL